MKYELQFSAKDFGTDFVCNLNFKCLNERQVTNIGKKSVVLGVGRHKNMIKGLEAYIFH